VRQALNKNPAVQIALLGIGAVAMAILLLGRLGGGEDEPQQQSGVSLLPGGDVVAAAEAQPAAGTSATGSSDAAIVDPAASSTASAGATSSVIADPAPAPVGSVVPSALIPGEGLPRSVVVAYARDTAVVLLVVKKRGIDDRAVEAAVERLRPREDVAVFVTPVKSIASYARITQGVQVNRTPALIVILPRSRTASVPTATVSYGFRDARSVERAVDDALYRGPAVQYYPE
jgi:hypothetical protein